MDLIQPRALSKDMIHPSNIEAAKKTSKFNHGGLWHHGHDAARRAREMNLDLIITDHHKEAKEGLPEAFAVINPNRADENLFRFSNRKPVSALPFVRA